MKEVGDKYGFVMIMEVMSGDMVFFVFKYVDIFQIGV